MFLKKMFNFTGKKEIKNECLALTTYNFKNSNLHITFDPRRKDRPPAPEQQSNVFLSFVKGWHFRVNGTGTSGGFCCRSITCSVKDMNFTVLFHELNVEVNLEPR